MNRFEQRLRARLRDEEFAAGYREMDAELQLPQAREDMGAATAKQSDVHLDFSQKHCSSATTQLPLSPRGEGAGG